MKKLLALALTLMMVLSLAACGGKTDPAPSGNSTSDPGTSQQEPSNTSDPGTADSIPADSGEEWPDNEFTQKVPEIPFSITSASDDGDGTFTVRFSDATIADGKAYGAALQEAGFNVNARGDLDTEDRYSLFASNADGWSIEYDCSDTGFGSLYINKP